jgi:DNA ligase D-like protein (predicted polymerase)
MSPSPREQIVVEGREVAVSNPQKILFPKPGHTKLDLVRYYLAVAPGALRGAGGRPNMLARYPDGIESEFFYQKRAPKSRPPWIEVVALRFPSGRSAEEVVPRDAAALAWMANLACLELHPHPVRAEDLEHPDELRVDLDPVPGVEWKQVREVAKVVNAVLEEFGLAGWPKTSGKRGLHVNVRIEKRWTFDEVRRAALALAREVERRAGARHQQMVEGGAPRRVRRLQPERQGPHRRGGLLGAPDARGDRLGADHLAGARVVRAARFHAEDDAGTVRENRRPPRRDRRQRGRACGTARALREAGTRRPGRCAVAAVLREKDSFRGKT